MYRKRNYSSLDSSQITLLNTHFQKRIPQKIYFQNSCCNSKLLSQKYILKSAFLKNNFLNCSLKKYIFKVTISKKTFSNLLSQKYTFSKLLF